VRGTTSEQIVDMARTAGAKKVYFASAAPEIRYPNVYGIDMPTSSELIAFGRDTDEVAKLIGVDKLIFQDLADLTGAVQQENPSIKEFDCSVFTGCYVTGDISEDYLEQIAVQRNDTAKKKREKDSSNLEMYNER
ncbi:MAG: amidophosphoribosyltransferase, partial [Aggregatibacter aphrophilus]|nr:amidophosphoribosyltransferase [Aggregatibacter aphrophilus]